MRAAHFLLGLNLLLGACTSSAEPVGGIQPTPDGGSTPLVRTGCLPTGTMVAGINNVKKGAKDLHLLQFEVQVATNDEVGPCQSAQIDEVETQGSGPGLPAFQYLLMRVKETPITSTKPNLAGGVDALKKSDQPCMINPGDKVQPVLISDIDAQAVSGDDATIAIVGLKVVIGGGASYPVALSGISRTFTIE